MVSNSEGRCLISFHYVAPASLQSKNTLLLKSFISRPCFVSISISFFFAFALFASSFSSPPPPGVILAIDCCWDMKLTNPLDIPVGSRSPANYQRISSSTCTCCFKLCALELHMYTYNRSKPPNERNSTITFLQLYICFQICNLFT